MTIVRAQSPFRWLRRLLLLLGILTVLAIVVLLAAFQFGRTDRASSEGGGLESQGTDPDTITAGQGFEYTQVSEGRKVFRLRADRSQQDRSDNAFLDTVMLDIFREDGETYTITSRRAEVNQTTWAARLEGDVVISGWDDLVLEARELKLIDGGQVLESVGAVEFRYPPDLVGRATELLIDRRSDTISLREGVHLRNLQSAEVPIRLDCQRLIFRREEGVVRALDDVFLRHGPQELRARFLTLMLGEGEDAGLESLRARWEVSGTMRGLGEGQGDLERVDFSGSFLQLEPNENRPEARSIRLEGEPGQPATIQVVDASGLARRLTGDFLTSQMLEAGPLQIVEGFGDPLVLDEFLDFPEPFYLRQACGKRAVARFLPDGTVSRVNFENQVELRSEELQLSGGDRAYLDLEDGKLEIEGSAVQLFSERGDLVAPKFVYTRDTGFIRAEGGVRASLQREAMSSLTSTPFGQGRGPIRVESREAFFTDAPRTFSFRGGVRAWQAQNLILAEQLRGDESAQELAASGPVKTVWVSSPDSGVGGEPIEVTAARLTYRQAENLLVYDDDVQVLQASRSLRCQELTVELDPEGSRRPDSPAARRMTCHGGVEMRDPVARRQISGDTAVYTLASEQIEIFGKTVKLVDQQKNTLTGRYLIYDLDEGTVQLQSRRPGAAAAAGNR